MPKKKKQFQDVLTHDELSVQFGTDDLCMQEAIDFNALIDLYEEARAKDNNLAKELLAKAIFELMEKQSLEESIKVKYRTAKALIHAGSV